MCCQAKSIHYKTSPKKKVKTENKEVFGENTLPTIYDEYIQEKVHVYERSPDRDYCCLLFHQEENGNWFMKSVLCSCNPNAMGYHNHLAKPSRIYCTHSGVHKYIYRPDCDKIMTDKEYAEQANLLKEARFCRIL
jgi:hypothetical protein